MEVQGGAGPDPALQERIASEVDALVPQARAEGRRAWAKAPHALDEGEMEGLALYGLAQAASRWPGYCAEKGHDPWAFHYFTAFCLRRIRGAMLDEMRRMDHVTRNDRTLARAIRDVAQSAPLTEAEVAAELGIPVAKVRAINSAVSARPVYMDAEEVTVASEDNVESSALVSGALRAAERAVRGLPRPDRDLVLLRHVYGLTVSQAASVARVPVADAVASLRASAEMVRGELARAMGVALS